MAAMMPATSGGNQTANPYEHYDAPVEDDLIDPDDATLDELDDPVNQSDRAPLTGRITNNQAQSNTRAAGNTQGYLNSAIPGEDRRAPLNTIDETVWETLRRDLLAVWEKMKQVLYPKYLFGGVMNSGAGIAGEQGGEGEGLMGGAGGTLGHIRSVVGRWPDADAVLQGGMSEGLRDWDLWGPLLFCLLLSFLLSWNARDDQRSLVFSGVFAMIWIAEAVVTLQIKLLGGNISFFQSVCIIGYTLFPLVIASLLSALHVPTIVRIPVYSVLGLWSLAAGVSILGGSGVIKNRVALAVVKMKRSTWNITDDAILALVENDECLEVLKEKWHDDEQRLVKIYELRAEDIIRLVPGGDRRQRAETPDLIIKTFRASDYDRQTNEPARRESRALKLLERLGCEHAPTLRNAFSFIQDEDKVQVVVMEKIKGVTLSDAWDYMSARTKHEVRKAFKIARQAVADCEIWNGSPGLRNVMYNSLEDKWYAIISQRFSLSTNEHFLGSYIIDYERAEFGPVSRKKLRCPRWGLIKPEQCAMCSSRKGCHCDGSPSGINHNNLVGDEEQ
ncbi:hypothetical protein LTR37_013637 [Vermiconidia calcicola]|uniref:Uncharacterized protein n=1 Tax=Vermiconidia calcicola TaxID=1690605 RepID=A0ACC3MWM4_9PEZI|nr:hypothetical protein LTR37_013637 [Vermiconidia calcicola]